VARPETLLAMTYDSLGVAPLLEAGLRVGLKGYPGSPTTSTELIELAAAVDAEMVCIHASAMGVSSYTAARAVGVWTLPWAADGDVSGLLVQDLVNGGAGGVITNLPEQVQSLLDQYCL
jgi:hypothetical protein